MAYPNTLPGFNQAAGLMMSPARQRSMQLYGGMQPGAANDPFAGIRQDAAARREVPQAAAGLPMPVARTPLSQKTDLLRAALQQTMGLVGMGGPTPAMPGPDAGQQAARAAAQARNQQMIGQLTGNPDGRFWQGAQIQNIAGRNQYVSAPAQMGTATIPGGYQQWRANQPGPTPVAAGLPNVDLAANRTAYLDKRAAKQAAIQENIRLKKGLLTMDEIQALGVPGLAVEQQRGKNAAGLVDAQGKLQTGMQKRQLAAAERMQSAQQAHDLAIQSGNTKAAAKAQKNMLAAQKEMAGLQAQTAERVAGINAGPAQEQARAQGRLADATVRQSDQAAIGNMLQQARDAENAGDFARAQQLRQQASAMQSPAGLPGVQQPPPTTQQPVAMPQQWSAVPPELRQRVKGATPEEMVSNLRTIMPGLPQATYDAMLQEAYPGTTVSVYNPDGFGVSDYLGGLTGLENINRGVRYLRNANGANLPVPPTPAVLPGIGWLQQYMGF